MSRHPIGRAPARALLASVAALVAVLALSVCLPVAPAGAEPAPRYRPPVEAPVVDPFRPPEGPYGAGNRGLEYGTEPGTPVLAAADGVVTFAGAVAGGRHVTVRHDDGYRTTASYLDQVDVVVGQRVVQGDRLGTTVGHLHFGARVGDAYFDPAALFEEGPPKVRLVPFDEPPGPGERGERSAIGQLLHGLGGGLDDALGLAQDVVGGPLHALRTLREAVEWADEHGEQALRTLLHDLRAFRILNPTWVLTTVARVAWRAYEVATRPCTRDDQAVPPPVERRIGVLVAGFLSTSSEAAIDELDVDGLGYDAGDVLRFSYRGGHTPDPTSAIPGLEVSSYGSSDSQVDLRDSAARLADLVEDVAAAEPGVPIDLLAHSQGGLVARLALIELEERHGLPWLDRIGLLATIATPHGGANIATSGWAIAQTPLGNRVFEAVEHLPLSGEFDDDLPAFGQLSEVSSVVRELDRHPVPAGVDGISVAARGDLVVPVPRAELPGAPRTVVPLIGLTAHGDLPGDPRTTRALAVALAGGPPPCTSYWNALLDEGVGEGVSAFEDLATGGLAALTVRQSVRSLDR